MLTFKNLRNGAVALIIRGKVYRGFKFSPIVGLLARFSYQYATLVDGRYQSLSLGPRTLEIERLKRELNRDWIRYMQFEVIFVDSDMRFEEENQQGFMEAWRTLRADSWFEERGVVIAERKKQRGLIRAKFESKKQFIDRIRGR